MATLQKQRSLSVVSLTPQARTRLPKPHRDFEAYVEPLLALYQAHPEMQLDALDPERVRAALAAYTAAAPDEVAATARLEAVKDERLQQSSAVWQAMLEIYARAQVFARTDPTLKQAIADFGGYMKQGPHRKRGKAPASGAPPASNAA